jgi:hypothetical protein
MFLRSARWVPASGILFAALVVVATLLTTGVPGADASDAAWGGYYADAGNRRGEEIAFFLIGLAGICFLSFLGSLRGTLARAEGEPARLTTAATASGGVFIALAILAHAIGSSMSWARTHYGVELTIDPHTARLLASLSFVVFVMAMFAAASMALATTVLAAYTRVFPAWLTWFGALAALGGVLSIFALPSLVTLAWIVAVSAWLLVPQRAPEAQPASSR